MKVNIPICKIPKEIFSFNPYQKIVQLSRKDKIFGITYTLQ